MRTLLFLFMQLRVYCSIKTIKQAVPMLSGKYLDKGVQRMDKGTCLLQGTVLRVCRNQPRGEGKRKTRCSRQAKVWKEETENTVPTERKSGSMWQKHKAQGRVERHEGEETSKNQIVKSIASHLWNSEVWTDFTRFLELAGMWPQEWVVWRHEGKIYRRWSWLPLLVERQKQMDMVKNHSSH